jgi:hypothetical protein
MKCPHCATSFHEDFAESFIPTKAKGHTAYKTRHTVCPECKKPIILFGIPQVRHEPDHNPIIFHIWQLIYPEGSNRPPVSDEVPADITEDYAEAARVLPYSAKASAALSRRCLQAVLRAAGYTQKDLAKQIDALLAEEHTRKALPTSIHMTVDSIRNFGNFSAHPITDQTTLQVVEVEPHEAEHSLDILDALFDHYYVRPAEAKRKKAALDAKLQAAGKPPSK